jgi:hypothetical protein
MVLSRLLQFQLVPHTPAENSSSHRHTWDGSLTLKRLTSLESWVLSFPNLLSRSFDLHFYKRKTAAYDAFPIGCAMRRAWQGLLGLDRRCRVLSISTLLRLLGISLVGVRKKEVSSQTDLSSANCIELVHILWSHLHAAPDLNRAQNTESFRTINRDKFASPELQVQVPV